MKMTKWRLLLASLVLMTTAAAARQEYDEDAHSHQFNFAWQKNNALDTEFRKDLDQDDIDGRDTLLYILMGILQNDEKGHHSSDTKYNDGIEIIDSANLRLSNTKRSPGERNSSTTFYQKKIYSTQKKYNNKKGRVFKLCYFKLCSLRWPYK